MHQRTPQLSSSLRGPVWRSQCIRCMDRKSKRSVAVGPDPATAVWFHGRDIAGRNIAPSVISHRGACVRSSVMAERDEVQAARWFAIRDRVGEYLRALRVRAGAVSQARLSSDLEALGYRMTQSMVSRYEQGVLDAPLSLERIVGWALCCEALSDPMFGDIMSIAGYQLAAPSEDLERFDRLLAQYRALPMPDQVVLRRSLLWHLLGLRPAPDSADDRQTSRTPPRGSVPVGSSA